MAHAEDCASVHSPARAHWAGSDTPDSRVGAGHFHAAHHEHQRQHRRHGGDTSGPSQAASSSSNRQQSESASYHAQLAALIEQHGPLAFAQQRGSELHHHAAGEGTSMARGVTPPPVQSQHWAPHRAALSLAANGAYDDFVVLLAARQPDWYKVLQSAPPLAPVVGTSSLVHMAAPAPAAPATSGQQAGGTAPAPPHRGLRTAAPSRRPAARKPSHDGGSDEGPAGAPPPDPSCVVQGGQLPSSITSSGTHASTAAPNQLQAAPGAPATSPVPPRAVRQLQEQGSGCGGGGGWRPGSAPASLKARIEGPRRQPAAPAVLPLALALQAQRRAWEAQLAQQVVPPAGADSLNGSLHKPSDVAAGGSQIPDEAAAAAVTSVAHAHSPSHVSQERGTSSRPAPDQAGDGSAAASPGMLQPECCGSREPSTCQFSLCGGAGDQARAGHIRILSPEPCVPGTEGVGATSVPAATLAAALQLGGGTGAGSPKQPRQLRVIIPGEDGHGSLHGERSEGQASAHSSPLPSPFMCMSPSARPGHSSASGTPTHCHSPGAMSHGHAHKRAGAVQPRGLLRPQMHEPQPHDPVSMLLASMELDKLAATITTDGAATGTDGPGSPCMHAPSPVPRTSFGGSALQRVAGHAAASRMSQGGNIPGGLGRRANQGGSPCTSSPQVPLPLDLLLTSEQLVAAQRAPRISASSSQTPRAPAAGMGHQPQLQGLSSSASQLQVQQLDREQPRVLDALPVPAYLKANARSREYGTLMESQGMNEPLRAVQSTQPRISSLQQEQQQQQLCEEVGEAGAGDYTSVLRGVHVSTVDCGMGDGPPHDVNMVEGCEEWGPHATTAATSPDPGVSAGQQEQPLGRGEVRVHSGQHRAPQPEAGESGGLRHCLSVPLPLLGLARTGGSPQNAQAPASPLAGRASPARGLALPAPLVASISGQGHANAAVTPEQRMRSRQAAAAAMAAAAAAAAATAAEVLRRPPALSLQNQDSMYPSASGPFALLEQAASPARAIDGAGSGGLVGSPVIIPVGSVDRTSAPSVLRGTLRAVPSATRRPAVGSNTQTYTSRPPQLVLARPTSILPPLLSPQSSQPPQPLTTTGAPRPLLRHCSEAPSRVTQDWWTQH